MSFLPCWKQERTVVKMDNFKAIYRILSELEKAMDKKECDVSRFDHEQLGITEERWVHYIEMLSDAGYVKGASITENLMGDVNCDVSEMKITLKGIEYLHENSTMQKVIKAAKGIKDIVPGM